MNYLDMSYGPQGITKTPDSYTVNIPVGWLLKEIDAATAYLLAGIGKEYADGKQFSAEIMQMKGEYQALCAARARVIAMNKPTIQMEI